MQTESTIIHAHSFDERFQEKLISTLVESLRGGESFDYVSSQPPEAFVAKIVNNHSGDVLVDFVKKEQNQWRVRVLRAGAGKSKGSGCCGGCSG